MKKPPDLLPSKNQASQGPLCADSGNTGLASSDPNPVDQRQATLQAYRALGYHQVPRAKPMVRGQAIEAIQAAQTAPGLSALIKAAQQAQGPLKALKGLVAAPILAQLQAGPIEAGTWVLSANSAPAANKLRQMVPALCAHLRTKGFPIEHILIKLTPKG